MGYTRRNHQRIEIHSPRPSIKFLTTVIRKTVVRQRIVEHVDGGFTMVRVFEAQRNRQQLTSHTTRSIGSSSTHELLKCLINRCNVCFALTKKLTGKKLKIIQHDLNYHIMNSAPNTESTINHNTTRNTTRKHQRVSSEDGFLFFNLRSNFRFNPTFTEEY